MIAAGAPSIWPAIASFSHFAGACAAVTVGVWVWPRRAKFGLAGNAIVASLALTALWCLTVAVTGGDSLEGEVAISLRNLAYIMAVYRLFAGDGRHTSVAPVRPVVIALGFANFFQPLAMLIESRIVAGGGHNGMAFHLNVMLAMLGAVGSLVLVHNLYVGAVEPFRSVLRWPATAFAMIWGFELNLYTAAYLGNRWPVELAAVHGVVDIGFAVILAIGASHGREALRLRPSRAMTFHSFSLLLIGAYFLAMVGIAQWLSYAGGDFARWLQFGFLIVASATALLTLPSRRIRGWLRVTLTKHLFQHRYDYRAEWLRFTHTVSSQDEEAAPLHQRAIRAVADITDSPAGMLLAPNEQGEMALAANWHWQENGGDAVEIAASVLSLGLTSFLERNGYILDLDGLRAGRDDSDAVAKVPDWLIADASAWAVVPLIHFDRMVAAVVLARPPHARTLDWEDFDLLRVVGQQLASYLAEHSGQQALIEAARFDDFHRRIAFVMHDIKNLASQFSLLARNAERHAENPAFRADMLTTLRNSADKLNTLIARLSRYGATVDQVEPVAVVAVAKQVAAGYAQGHPVSVIDRHECDVSANRESLEQVLRHLVQNAVDASEDQAPVFMSVASDGLFCMIDVVDSGHGMSPEFIRNRLFKPFDSTKQGGFGIGAYEARELIKAMGGRLDVESRVGIGSRFCIRMPLVTTAALLKNIDDLDEKVA
ncbi:MAG: hypothetical protein RLY97_1791 [Pseudomonadota bacterium]